MARRIPSLFLKSALLAFESQQVIPLRMMRIAVGGAAAKGRCAGWSRRRCKPPPGRDWPRARRSLREKRRTVAGATITRYRAKVRKNRARLIKGERALRQDTSIASVLRPLGSRLRVLDDRFAGDGVGDAETSAEVLEKVPQTVQSLDEKGPGRGEMIE